METTEQSTSTETQSTNFSPDLGALFKSELTRVKVVDSPESKITAPSAEPPVKEVEPPKTATPAIEKVKPAVEWDAAKPNATAKPLEAKPDEVGDFEKGLSKNSQKRFVELAAKKAEALAATIAAKQVEEKLKAAKVMSPEEAARMSKLEKDNADLLSELRRLGVERSPEYQAKFVEGPQKLKESMSSILDIYNINKTEFFAALADPSSKENRLKLNELIDSAGRLDSAELADLTRRYGQLEKEKATVASDPETAIEVLKQENEKRVKAFQEKLQSDRKAALPNIIEEAQKEGADWFASEDGKQFQSSILPRIQELNTRDLETADPAIRAQLITAAFLAKPFYQSFVAKSKEAAQLRTQLDAYEKGAPPLGGSSSDTPVVKEEDQSIFGKAFGYEPKRV